MNIQEIIKTIKTNESIGLSEKDITDFEKVVELDRYYILNWSLGLDVKIIFRTVPEVVKKNGSM